MAERTDAFASRIGDAMKLRLEEHVAANADQWRTAPADVKFGLDDSWEQGPFPLVGITIPSLTDQNLDATGGRSEVAIMIIAFVSEPSAPERALHEMVADIRRAFVEPSDGRQLGTVLASGLLFFDGWEIAPDPSGISVAVLNYRGLFQWDESAA